MGKRNWRAPQKIWGVYLRAIDLLAWKTAPSCNSVFFCVLKLPIRHPGRQPSTGPAADLVDMSPSDFVNLTLPIYKTMSPMAGHAGMAKEDIVSMLTTANHYTSVSFIRLVALASRRLRLSPAHFRAVLQALMHQSGMILTTNLSQEQVGQPMATNLSS